MDLAAFQPPATYFRSAMTGQRQPSCLERGPSHAGATKSVRDELQVGAERVGACEPCEELRLGRGGPAQALVPAAAMPAIDVWGRRAHPTKHPRLSAPHGQTRQDKTQDSPHALKHHQAAANDTVLVTPPTCPSM